MPLSIRRQTTVSTYRTGEADSIPAAVDLRRKAGKRRLFAFASFSSLPLQTSEMVFPGCLRVVASLLPGLQTTALDPVRLVIPRVLIPPRRIPFHSMSVRDYGRTRQCGATSIELSTYHTSDKPTHSVSHNHNTLLAPVPHEDSAPRTSIFRHPASALGTAVGSRSPYSIPNPRIWSFLILSGFPHSYGRPQRT